MPILILGLLAFGFALFSVAVAGRRMGDEPEALARAGYAAVLAGLGIDLDVDDPTGDAELLRHGGGLLIRYEPHLEREHAGRLCVDGHHAVALGEPMG